MLKFLNMARKEITLQGWFILFLICLAIIFVPIPQNKDYGQKNIDLYKPLVHQVF